MPFKAEQKRCESLLQNKEYVLPLALTLKGDQRTGKIR